MSAAISSGGVAEVPVDVGPDQMGTGGELPRLSSGEAFPQAERAQFVGTNMSFYGLLVKLRAPASAPVTSSRSDWRC